MRQLLLNEDGTYSQQRSSRKDGYKLTLVATINNLEVFRLGGNYLFIGKKGGKVVNGVRKGPVKDLLDYLLDINYRYEGLLL